MQYLLKNECDHDNPGCIWFDILDKHGRRLHSRSMTPEQAGELGIPCLSPMQYFTLVQEGRRNASA